jgi:hypothetical protein
VIRHKSINGSGKRKGLKLDVLNIENIRTRNKIVVIEGFLYNCCWSINPLNTLSAHIVSHLSKYEVSYFLYLKGLSSSFIFKQK